MAATVTLDTSCAVNLVNRAEPIDPGMRDLIRLALTGLADVRVTTEAVDEISATPNADLRATRVEDLRALEVVALAPSHSAQIEREADVIRDALFPNARRGSRTWRHNHHDARQLVAHRFTRRDWFVTLDKALLDRAALLAAHDITVFSPAAAAARLTDETRGTAAVLPYFRVRTATADDGPEIHRVLGPLSDDYPGFADWLNRQLRPGGATVRIAEHGERVGAVALSKAKDDRVTKLSAFYVDQRARQAGLGQHLLWHEIRSWAEEKVEKVFVTVSSRHPEAVEFFSSFGFLVEGVSARRYADEFAEIVLAKHFVRRRYGPDELEEFLPIARSVFAGPANVTSKIVEWALPPPDPSTVVEWDVANAAIVVSAGGLSERRIAIDHLEQLFYPARFALSNRPVLLVPIRPAYASQMLTYRSREPTIFDNELLFMRADNAYFATPGATDAATSPGTPALFYVTAPVSAIVGEARIREGLIAPATDLHARLGRFGVLTEDRIAVMERRGKALGIRFGDYVAYSRAVPLAEMRAEGVSHPQGLATVSYDRFERIRSIGGCRN